jgi:hypothetical protein
MSTLCSSLVRGGRVPGWELLAQVNLACGNALVCTQLPWSVLVMVLRAASGLFVLVDHALDVSKHLLLVLHLRAAPASSLLVGLLCFALALCVGRPLLKGSGLPLKDDRPKLSLQLKYLLIDVFALPLGQAALLFPVLTLLLLFTRFLAVLLCLTLHLLVLLECLLQLLVEGVELGVKLL